MPASLLIHASSDHSLSLRHAAHNLPVWPRLSESICPVRVESPSQNALCRAFYRSARRHTVDKGQKLSRRDFLRLSALGAASTMIAACGGPAAQPPAPPAAATAAVPAAATAA